MQTAMLHGNHIDGFFLTHTQSLEIIDFDIILPYQNSSNIQGCSDTPIYFTFKIYPWIPYQECFQ